MKATDWKSYYLNQNIAVLATQETNYPECDLKQNSKIGINCDITEENKDKAIIVLRLMAELPELFSDIKMHKHCDDYLQMLTIDNNIKELALAARGVLAAKI